MAKNIIKISISFSVIFIITGIIIAFIDLSTYCIYIKNDGYVGAFFSLSGIVLYFTALMYQIKEYKLQVIELRKSVEAQTKSSEALENQKNILIEQNTNNLIFGMINSFNNFKKQNNTQSLIDNLAIHFQMIFALVWRDNLNNNKRLTRKDLNVKFATDIKRKFSEIIVEQPEFLLFRNYISFIYNILYVIDQNSDNLTHNYFKPFFFSQLNTTEYFMICLSNLDEWNMPNYPDFKWGNYETKTIVEIIKKFNKQNIDFNELDIQILTNEFKEIKQQ
ncbi:MAG: hypothetical protein GXO79_03580 [Chlorobi bacterium]|nr:hypothetical protein [Chlorobiota bacterium]